MVEAKLPPGFRFHPRDDELVCDYLLVKIAIGSSNDSLLLIEVDLNKSEPWEIPGNQSTVLPFLSLYKHEAYIDIDNMNIIIKSSSLTV